MVNSPKKEIYIPIEIKPREFVSQLLLSGELAKKGLRVYIGSKKSIDLLIEKKHNTSGIYLYKGGGSNLNKFKKLSKQVEAIAVLDQEISPATRDYNIIKNRFVKGCLKYVSRLYYVGSEAQKTAINVLDEIEPSKIKAYGWPRIDIWQPSLHHIWQNEIKSIKSRFPEPFILFTSDFGTNSLSLLRQQCLWTEKRGAKKTRQEISIFKNIYKKNYELFLTFIDFLSKIDTDKEIPKIIVRPHPGEDHQEWINKLKFFSKVDVIYEGDVSPWILASEGVLQRGCTCSIEAAISEKKIGFLSDYAIKKNDSLSEIVSHKITNLKTLRNWLRIKNEGVIEDKNFYKQLKKHIVFSDKSAASKIALDLSKLTDKSTNPSHIFEKHKKESNNIQNFERIITMVFRKAVSFFRKVINYFYKKPNYIPNFYKKNKMQNGIHLSESKFYLSLMFPKIKLNVEETSVNLIKIESS
tara:strand:+ start:3181 stop:4581 length:1401 start_codon:yes stop_codon:yes gene_type:complete